MWMGVNDWAHGLISIPKFQSLIGILTPVLTTLGFILQISNAQDMQMAEIRQAYEATFRLMGIEKLPAFDEQSQFVHLLL